MLMIGVHCHLLTYSLTYLLTYLLACLLACFLLLHTSFLVHTCTYMYGLLHLPRFDAFCFRSGFCCSLSCLFVRTALGDVPGTCTTHVPVRTLYVDKELLISPIFCGWHRAEVDRWLRDLNSVAQAHNVFVDMLRWYCCGCWQCVPMGRRRSEIRVTSSSTTTTATATATATCC